MCLMGSFIIIVLLFILRTKNSIPIASLSIQKNKMNVCLKKNSWKFMRFWWSFFIVTGLVWWWRWENNCMKVSFIVCRKSGCGVVGQYLHTIKYTRFHILTKEGERERIDDNRQHNDFIYLISEKKTKKS